MSFVSSHFILFFPLFFLLPLASTYRDLQTLKIFPQLQTLILDKNFLTGVDLCPPLPCLHTLWLNNNAICDLPGTMDAIGIRFPRLRHLSMMRNPACPGLMDIVEPDLESCRLYRLYVLYRLPQLLYLDGIDVTDEERKEAKLRGQYAVKRQNNASTIPPNSSSDGSNKDNSAFSSSSRRSEAAPFVCKDGSVPGLSFSPASALGAASGGELDPDSLPLHPGQSLNPHVPICISCIV